MVYPIAFTQLSSASETQSNIESKQWFDQPRREDVHPCPDVDMNAKK